jgi:pimeloyl-ACP methyl ester carboxylesterase
VLTLLAVFAVVYVGGCYVLARRYVSPAREVAAMPAEWSAVSIENGDFDVPAWTTPGIANGKPAGQVVFVLVHGYGGNRGGWIEAGQALKDLGAEVVIPEMPAHGESPDPQCGFGVKEARCVVEVARWAKSRVQNATIVAVGVSMGGAACWLASELDPGAFDAIAAEDSFAILDEAVDRWFAMLLPGGRTLLRPVRWFADGMTGLNPAGVRPIDAARKWNGKPALVVHCADDPLMSASHSVRLAEAAGCELWTVPDARHAEGFAKAPLVYTMRLLDLAIRARKIEVKKPGRPATSDALK